jgi:hypothetical protein
VGDVGFDVASQGAEAILEELARIRVTSGRTSGRAGPQAVYGKLYTWLGSSALRAQAGPICDILREAIISNFPVGPGDIILGEVVKARVVHSANTLINKSGRNRKRFYKLLTKLGYIPDTRDAIATSEPRVRQQHGMGMVRQAQRQRGGIVGKPRIEGEPKACPERPRPGQIGHGQIDKDLHANPLPCCAKALP